MIDGLRRARSPVPFPLPITPFEYYYLLDDCPSYPMTFPVDLQFRGELDRGLFTAALAGAVDRHPMLRASIDDGAARPTWIPCAAQLAWLDWDDARQPIAHPGGEYIDLRQEAGLRVWVRTGDGQTRVLLQFHHACCDGIAAIKFIEDLLICYADAHGGKPLGETLGALDPKSLASRGDFSKPHAGSRSRWSPLAEAWGTAKHWSRAVGRRPTVLSAPANVPSDSLPLAPPILDFSVTTLSAERVQSLKHISTAAGASLNDLLLRDMFLAISNWNDGSHASSRGRIWLNVPINLRRRMDRAMPAANRISFAFVSLTPQQCRDRRAALASIHRQVRQIREQNSARHFLDGLGIARDLGILPWALSRKRSLATMVHSNLGRVFARDALPRTEGRLTCGGAILQTVAAVPPVRPLTRGAIAITEYAGELTISLRCDGSLFEPADRQSLLDKYGERLEESVELRS